MRRLAFILAVLACLAALPAGADDLPDGPGKDTFVNVCGQCHGLDVITGLKHTKAEWKAVVDDMAAYGASAKDEELDAIVNYLARNFGKNDTPAKPEAPPPSAK
jgi:mono/diheme cytochrome c family protein